MCPRRSNVEGANLGALVLRSHDNAGGSDSTVVFYCWENAVQSAPRSCVLRVERIWRLKPASAVAEVQMNGVRVRECIIHAIEGILFIAFVVHDGELWRIQKPPGV